MGGFVRDNTRRPALHRSTPPLPAPPLRARLRRQRHDVRLSRVEAAAGVLLEWQLARSGALRVQSAPLKRCPTYRPAPLKWCPTYNAYVQCDVASAFRRTMLCDVGFVVGDDSLDFDGALGEHRGERADGGENRREDDADNADRHWEFDDAPAILLDDDPPDISLVNQPLHRVEQL